MTNTLTTGRKGRICQLVFKLSGYITETVGASGTSEIADLRGGRNENISNRAMREGGVAF